MSETEGYKGHRPGSNKEKVHKVFDEKGKEAAIKKAASLDLSESTARTWCSSWKKGGKKASDNARKPAGKKTSAKKSAKKASKPAVKRERIAANATA